ncbi:MAG: nucleotidyltransferase family protein [Candidatus Omnitrophica bacterium]|nr:nucleotidyltransferase family protein [Candidatus Omnitrophota bacterium]
MKTLILAAGYATRLYPLTKHWPKPLLVIKEKPIINHIIERIDGLQDNNEIIVITNEKFFHQFSDWARNTQTKAKLTVISDKTISADDRLGAIGDINFAMKESKIDDDLLVIGGDNLFNFDLLSFSNKIRKENIAAAVGLYDIKDPAMVNNYGVVTVDNNNKIIDFKEKPKKSASTLISMCIYYFSRNNLESIKKYINSKDCHDTSGDYIKWLSEELDVYGYTFDGTWYDIGDIITFYHASVTFNG